MNEDKLQDEIISVSVIEHDCKGGCSKGQVKSTPEFLATTEKEALDSENFMIVLPSYVFDLPFSVYTICSLSIINLYHISSSESSAASLAHPNQIFRDVAESFTNILNTFSNHFASLVVNR